MVVCVWSGAEKSTSASLSWPDDLPHLARKLLQSSPPIARPGLPNFAARAEEDLSAEPAIKTTVAAPKSSRHSSTHRDACGRMRDKSSGTI